MPLSNREIERILRMRQQAQQVFNELTRTLGPQWQSILSEVEKAREAYQQSAKLIQESFKVFIEYHKQLPYSVRRFLARLAEHGWFLHRDIHMSEMVSFAQLANEDSVNELDMRLSKYFKLHFSDFCKLLLTRHSERSHLLKLAFKAHRRGEFSLSIPIFLIQADGICSEFFGVQLYSKRGRTPLTAKIVDQLPLDSFSLAFFEPLRLVIPINEDTKHLKPGQFNRHAIIHGLDSKYGTKTNSFKAFSLLLYVSDQITTITSESTPN